MTNRISIYVVLILLIFGCNSISNYKKDMSSALYFSSPEEAINVITGLLQENDYKTLALYYDLRDSNVDISDLNSGDFFIREERPEVAHPAGLWHYKHPFPPGSAFQSQRPASTDSVYIIEVSLSIEQGEESPMQIALSYFYMIKSEKGWKILPDHVEESDLKGEMPQSF